MKLLKSKVLSQQEMNYSPVSINFLKHSQRIITEDCYNDKLLLLDRKCETVLQSTFEA